MKHYINLTNGIEKIPELINLGINPNEIKFIRIQSSLCERQKWMDILQDLDYTFLMDLILGNNVIVYDYGAKKDTARAIYQGITWIRYALNKFYFGIETDSFVRNHNVTKYFSHEYDSIFKYNLTKEKEKLKKKLNYFKKFIPENVNKVLLNGISEYTNNDQNFSMYKELLINNLTIFNK